MKSTKSKDDSQNEPSDAGEYQKSPDAPYNQKTHRRRGSAANESAAADSAETREDEIEREKQYFHGGKKPSP